MNIEADERTSSGGESGGDGGGGGVSSDDDAQTTPLLHEVDLFVEPDLISAGGRNSYDASSGLHRLILGPSRRAFFASEEQRQRPGRRCPREAAAGRPQGARPPPLARSTAKGVPRLGDGARWAPGGRLALCGGLWGGALDLGVSPAPPPWHAPCSDLWLLAGQ